MVHLILKQKMSGFSGQVSLTRSGFMTKYPIEETRQSDAATDVWANADDRATSGQDAALTPCG